VLHYCVYGVWGQMLKRGSNSIPSMFELGPYQVCSNFIHTPSLLELLIYTKFVLQKTSLCFLRQSCKYICSVSARVTFLWTYLTRRWSRATLLFLIIMPTRLGFLAKNGPFPTKLSFFWTFMMFYNFQIACPSLLDVLLEPRHDYCGDTIIMN